MNITLDRQAVAEYCPECDADFTVVRGSVFDDGSPFGLYLIALHGHCPDGLMAHLAIAVLDRSVPQRFPEATAMRVISYSDRYGYVVVDWTESPFQHEAFLGKMLDREEALASQHRETFFHVAGHIVNDLPDARAYFAGESTS